MEEKKWKKFEDATHEVVREFHPAKDVYKGVYIQGKLSKVKRQVDIQIVDPEGYDFIALECKDHNRPVDVSVVEAFNTTLMDIGAKKGALVSNSDFTQAAINMAEALGIDLLHLVDTGNKDVRSEILANVLIVDAQIKSWRFGLSGTAPMTISSTDDPRNMIFIDGSGEKVTAHDILVRLWNEEDASLAQTPGMHDYVPEKQGYRILDPNGEIFPIDKISFSYEVVERYYAGKVLVEKTRGLYNVVEKSLQTKEVLFQQIEPSVFEQENQEITKEEADKLGFALGIYVRSVYPSSSLG